MVNISSVKDLRQLPFPIPPIEEQRRIVEEVEKHLSIAAYVEGVVEQILKQAERLRQSILKKAFAGKLVPQDPNDESADKLLERIREERTRMNRNEKKVKIKNVNQLRLV